MVKDCGRRILSGGPHMQCREDRDILQWLRMLNGGYSLEGSTCSAVKMWTTDNG
ncbi:hypothetical protein DPMN_079544 [Dreissena polymorpha]|uniref:Uncharacterized protein n=1 Tax=Dreissena polymorpha TaxID=45954 RepID=A0A9D3YUN2_DREPO|nr:hypothetical protein DPMN_079544 [Dreissena polymorpha]